MPPDSGILGTPLQQIAALQEHVRSLEAELRRGGEHAALLQGDIERMRAQMAEAHAHRQRVMDAVTVARTDLARALAEARSETSADLQAARRTFRRGLWAHAILDGALLLTLLGLLLSWARGGE